MNEKNDSARPLRVGKVVLYYVTLNTDRNLSPKEKESKFQEIEWRLSDPFLPGFEPANRLEDIVYLEYVEEKKISVNNFGQKFEVSREKRCRIFDLMEKNREGFILVHPNGVSKSKEHLRRYLARLGYLNGQYECQRITYDKNQLLEVFNSSGVEKRGIRFETESGEIEFWTDTDLTKDIFYNACRKVDTNVGDLKVKKNIEMENIIKINVFYSIRFC